MHSQTQRRRFHVLPLVLFAVFGAVYYFSNQEVVPMTGRKQFVDMSVEQEQALGLQSYAAVLSQEDVITRGPEADQVRSVGARIAKVVEGPGFDWEFNTIRSPQINAFCLPGGKVAVYSGILPVAQTENGLAVVMGHEIAHAIARHGAERMAQSRLFQMGQLAVGMSVRDMDEGTRRGVLGAFGLGAQYGLLLPFSREHESEADHIGLLLTARACFDPTEAPKFWSRMQAAHRSGNPPEFLSTHPNPERRIDQLNSWMEEALRERAKYCGNPGNLQKG